MRRIESKIDVLTEEIASLQSGHSGPPIVAPPGLTMQVCLMRQGCNKVEVPAKQPNDRKYFNFHNHRHHGGSLCKHGAADHALPSVSTSDSENLFGGNISSCANSRLVEHVHAVEARAQTTDVRLHLIERVFCFIDIDDINAEAKLLCTECITDDTGV